MLSVNSNGLTTMKPRNSKFPIHLPNKKYPIQNDCNNSNNTIHTGMNDGYVSYGLSSPNTDGSPPNLFLQNIQTRMQRYYENK